MKLSTLFAVAAAALGLASTALAQTTIYIAGAPALRKELTTAIEALVDAGGGTPVRAYDGTNIIAAAVVSWTNATVAGQNVNIKLTYNGSAGGWQSTGGNRVVRYLPNQTTVAPFDRPNQVNVLTTLAPQPADEHIPDFHISNEFQNSTPWIGTNDLAYGTSINYGNGLSDIINGILPLRLVASPAAPDNLNITPQLVQTLYGAGEIRLSQLTGNSADYNKKVYPLSRGIDSGIRTIWAANNGYGTTTEIQSWFATVTPPSTPADRKVKGTYVTSGGTSYTVAPTVAFAAPTGSGGGTTATGTANLVADPLAPGKFKVSSITITNPGTNYIVAPRITITRHASDTTGKLAAATAAIESGTTSSHVLYPAGTIIGVPFNEGNGGYETFPPLLLALSSTLQLNPKPAPLTGFWEDIYLTVLSDVDAQVAFAAGAKEVKWNGNTLGTLGTYGNAGTVTTSSAPNPSTGSASAALAYGQYELWGYSRLASKTTISGVQLQIRNAISDRLKTVDAPVLLKDVNVQRSSPDGGAVIPGRKL